MEHKLIPTGSRHGIHNWVAADAAARLAISVVASDVGKVCRQSDTGEFWILKSEVGPIWGSLGAGGASGLQIEWGVFNATGTLTLRRGSGAHTITNPATGVYAITFGSGHTFPDGDYSLSVIGTDDGTHVSNSYESGTGTTTTGSGFRVQFVNGSSVAQVITNRIRFMAVRDV